MRAGDEPTEVFPAGQDEALYQAALAVERDSDLTDEMAEWDVTVGDVLSNL